MAAMDLIQLVPQLMPQAVDWVEAESTRVAAAGIPLGELGLKLANKVGVGLPELIRIEFVDEFPLPDDPLLKNFALQVGFFGPQMAGVTYGHSVLIRRGEASVRLFSHEFRHVQQYETFGSIGAFLNEYLRQIVEIGYDEAPLEKDARDHELDEV